MTTWGQPDNVVVVGVDFVWRGRNYQFAIDQIMDGCQNLVMRELGQFRGVKVMLDFEFTRIGLL